MTELAPPGVSIHFTRLSASGSAGTHAGQDERTREQIASLDDATRLLAMISPQAIVLAHTATSYTLGRDAEAALVHRLEAASGTRFVTAFGGVVEALRCLGVRRIAYVTRYDEAPTSRVVRGRVSAIQNLSFSHCSSVNRQLPPSWLKVASPSIPSS